MEMFSSNVTSGLNQTEMLDIFCTELFVGPLVWVIFCVPCACVGLPASVWLLWVLIQRQHSGLSNDIYMLNLTIMDLIFNITAFPCSVNFFFWQDVSFSKVTVTFYAFNIIGRPLFMTCVCVDCYMAAVYPIFYMKKKHSRYKFGACALICGVTLFYGMCMAFNRKQRILGATVPYTVILPIIAFCDVAILRTLRKADPSGRSDIHPQKQRALQAITNSLVMTLVVYLPPVIMNGLSAMLPLNSQERFCYVFVPSLCSPFLGSMVMPLLYLGNLGGLKRLSKCVCRV